MIVITFLGTSSGIPTKNRNHPGIAIEYFSKIKDTLLFDCGENIQVQLMRAKISFMQISKIFITHWHADHFAGLIPLIQTMNLEGRKKELKIFGPEAKKYLFHIQNLYYYKPKFRIDPFDVELSEEPIKIDETKDYEIYAIKVKHTIPSVAYCFKEKDKWSIQVEKLKEMGLKRGKWLEELKRKGKYTIKGKEVKIEDVAILKKGLKIVYTGDTEYCENVVKLAKDADVLIHDATFTEEHKEEEKSHSSAKDASLIAKKANVKLLVLTHLSRRYQTKEDVESLKEEAQKNFENVIVASDFLQIILKTGEKPKISKLKIKW